MTTSTDVAKALRDLFPGLKYQTANRSFTLRKADIVRAKRARMGRTGPSIEALWEEYQRQVKIQRARASRKPRQPVPLQERLLRHLVRLAQQNSSHRSMAANLQPKDGTVISRDIPGRMWLISASKKVHYSNAVGDFWNHATWLAGIEDGQVFVVRIPSTVKRVRDAISWLKPAEVKKAEQSGKTVLRQGDIWFVESNKFDLSVLAGSRHEAQEHAPGLYVIRHPEHRPVELVRPMRALLSKRIVAGTARRAYD